MGSRYNSLTEAQYVVIVLSDGNPGWLQCACLEIARYEDVWKRLCKKYKAVSSPEIESKITEQLKWRVNAPERVAKFRNGILHIEIHLNQDKHSVWLLPKEPYPDFSFTLKVICRANKPFLAMLHIIVHKCILQDTFETDNKALLKASNVQCMERNGKNGLRRSA